MDCPHCRVPLAITERQGIEVDYCPQCRGVWLDRGELDKIIERAARQFDAPPPPQPAPPPPQSGGWGKPYRKDEHYGHHHGHKHHKRKSFLDDLFDF